MNKTQIEIVLTYDNFGVDRFHWMSGRHIQIRLVPTSSCWEFPHLEPWVTKWHPIMRLCLRRTLRCFFWPHGRVVSLHIHIYIYIYIYICIFLHIHIHISGHHSQAKGQWVLSAVQRLSGEMLSDIFTDSSSRGYLDGILSHQWTNSMQCREVVAQEAPCVGFRGV